MNLVRVRCLIVVFIFASTSIIWVCVIEDFWKYLEIEYADDDGRLGNVGNGDISLIPKF